MKIMNFLFGSKYPIFNKGGEISHKRPESFEEWNSRYKNSAEHDWRNHSGQTFQPETPRRQRLPDSQIQPEKPSG